MLLDLIYKEVSQALSQIENSDLSKLDIVVATNSKFGDFQTNVALQHAKILRKKPLDIAQNIANNLKSSAIFSKVEIANPGFVNMTIDTKVINKILLNMQSCKNNGIAQTKSQDTIIIDYSSPNIAKTMHVAHLRSTIIGDALKRIYRACGYNALGDNHIGDWGTQFGKILYAYKNFDKPKDIEEDSIAMLEKIYQEFNQKAENDKNLDDYARQELVLLQKKEEPNFSLWKKFIDISLKEFHKVYEQLNINFDMENGESFYNDDLQGIIDQLHQKGLCKESEGAQVVFFEDDKYPPCLVQKNDGSFLYATTDLATVFHRQNKLAANKAIYVTDNRQKLHFQQFFHISKQLGCNYDLEHVMFGLMKFGEGTVMSTRKGAVISLQFLLDEAKKRAYDVILDRDYLDDEKQEIARVVGLGAIKYQDLSQNPMTDITFTWEKALNLEGNSAPYLQYAYARARSIYRKYLEKYSKDELKSSDFIINFIDGGSSKETIEKELALHILMFGKAVHHAKSQNKPNLIADYLYQLSSKFSSFYNQIPILKEENQQKRSSLIHLTNLSAKTLKVGLDLLGIETLERM
ncbi:MAG: arginine--tRNA ligase [Candidatus Cloacimonadota bacterium]|nr:MAG: arginine--tRNA ligase [Candidatus Cloacimonadota bacterium]